MSARGSYNIDATAALSNKNVAINEPFDFRILL